MNRSETVFRRPRKYRWTVLLGGFLLSLVGGMSYAWGSFVIPLVNDWEWTATQATLPLTVLIIVFALTMIPAGWLQDKFGPRKVAFAGAALFLVGYLLASLLRYIPSHLWLILSYGLIVGTGCGLSYSCIAPAARKWYPNRPGFAVSVSVMGFGLAAVLLAPLKKSMIDRWNVDGTLMVLGFFVFAIASIGAALMRNPPDSQKKETELNPEDSAASQKEITPIEFVRMPVFYGLWGALAAVIGGGLTAINLLSAFGEIELALTPTKAALAVSVFSLVNGLGRPFAGWLADKVGTIKVMIAAYTVQFLVFFVLPFVTSSYILLLVCALLLGAGYAVTFALFPVLVASRCGTRNLGVNYGLVFSAFSLGAVTGLLGSKLLDITGSFAPAFILAGSTTIIGLAVIWSIRKQF